MANRRKPAAGPAGTSARASGKDGPQIIESAGHRWTDEAAQVFLDHLAATANFTASANKCGFSREAIYKRRRRDPAFDADCRAALAFAVDRIDALLLQGAERALDGRAPDPDSPIPPMSVADAIQVVKLHRPALSGQGRLPGWRGPPRPLEQVKGSILRKLSALARARGKGEPPEA